MSNSAISPYRESGLELCIKELPPPVWTWWDRVCQYFDVMSEDRFRRWVALKLSAKSGGNFNEKLYKQYLMYLTEIFIDKEPGHTIFKLDPKEVKFKGKNFYVNQRQAIQCALSLNLKFFNLKMEAMEYLLIQTIFRLILRTKTLNLIPLSKTK